MLGIISGKKHWDQVGCNAIFSDLFFNSIEANNMRYMEMIQWNFRKGTLMVKQFKFYLFSDMKEYKRVRKEPYRRDLFLNKQLLFQPKTHQLQNYNVDVNSTMCFSYCKLSILDIPYPEMSIHDSRYGRECQFYELDHWYRSFDCEYL